MVGWQNNGVDCQARANFSRGSGQALKVGATTLIDEWNIALTFRLAPRENEKLPTSRTALQK
jgi:hypothetical protein